MKIGEIAKSTENSEACSNEEVKTWAEETGITSRQARILLTSVFGPYAQDDEFGSRTVNPMELYHNQITRVQGAFSLRNFHGSWGLRMIQENISADSTLMDFPTLEAFENELTSHEYDIVGITSIVMNVEKVREMCRRALNLSPHSKIVVGGHVAAIPGLENMIDADHIVKGEGIRWMRRYLGEDMDTPIIHPPLESGFGLRIMGIRLPKILASKAATIVPSVGCPMGCNFCTTSAFFGGKGKLINFLKTGDEIFHTMREAESSLNAENFFVMDENFLLQKKRAMELLELMKKNDKSWSLYVFASANALKKYTMEELVELGVSIVWMGLESPNSGYSKLKGSDTKKLVQELQEHGIRVVGSTIIGMEHHTPENIGKETEYAVSHDTDFHQFMLYTPQVGTPLYTEMEKQDRLLGNVDLADIHGQDRFNFKHPAISYDDSKKFLDQAFERDFEKNGPSLYRFLRTALKGWKRYKNHPDKRVRRRFQKEAGTLKTVASPMLWAMEKMYKNKDQAMSEQICDLRLDIEKEFGLYSRIWTLLGPVILGTARREERRLAQGQTYEPNMFIERKNGNRKRQIISSKKNATFLRPIAGY